MLSFLPLAHAYGCAFDFLTATAVGTHVTLLGKTPSPKIIMKAFEEVKPNLIITVPLVIEKIYKNVIQPLINKKGMKWALNIPLLDTQIYNQIRKKLIDALGGRFKEIIIGGAAMNQEVEEFFYKIKFPFTIGYGMTECGPLISYAPWNEFILGSSGKVLDIMEARIYKENPEAETGEIQVRGENVMVGYYKESGSHAGSVIRRRLAAHLATLVQWTPAEISSSADDSKHDSEFERTEHLPRRAGSQTQ